MLIRHLAQLTGLSTKTIRYYESIGLLPRPERLDNNYRHYPPTAADRLRFISSARTLGFSLADIAEFLQAQDNQTLPCQQVLTSLDQRLADLDKHIANLLFLRDSLTKIREVGRELPTSEQCHNQCVCYLLIVNQENGQITIQQENIQDETK